MKNQPKEKEEGYELESLQVHQSSTIRHATESNFKAFKGYKMLYKSDGVHMEYLDVKFIIPLANVIVAVFK
jgi:hypothetical protein